MNIRKLLISILLLTAASMAALGQNVSDLVISEACPASEGLVDDYGRHSPWIELTNSSQGTVNFAGCFLTDDPTEPRKYMIPKGDAATKLGPRQVVLLWCSGDNDEGTLYSGLTLSPGKTVYLVSNDGKTIIDSLDIPADLPEGMSVSKFARDPKGMEFKADPSPTVPSPGMMNKDGETESGAQRMARTDPKGWILTVTSVAVVFLALVILWWIFTLIGKAFTKEKKKPAPKASADEGVAAAIALALDMESGGGTYAAIATALHLYLSQSVHDSESYIITIRPTEVKHQNFRKLPRKYGTV